MVKPVRSQIPIELLLLLLVLLLVLVLVLVLYHHCLLYAGYPYTYSRDKPCP